MTGYRRIVIFSIAGILGLISALIASCCFSVVQVQGESMEPAVRQGEMAVISKLAYLFEDPHIGDAVAFSCNVYSEDGEGSTLIKRVAATEGDEVQIKDGMFYVNGKVCDQYASESVYLEPMAPVTVGKDKVFVLSDNRKAVLDSRDQAVGQMEVSELLGKVYFK